LSGPNRATGPSVGDCKAARRDHRSAEGDAASGTLRDADITSFSPATKERPGSPVTIARRDLVEDGRAADVALEFGDLAREDGRDWHDCPALDQLDAARAAPAIRAASFVTSSAMARSTKWRVLDAFRRGLPEPNLTYNVGVIGGGT
jgi:glutamate carboxypeptidase